MSPRAVVARPIVQRARRLPAESLAFALAHAAQALLAVRNGQSLPKALAQVFAEVALPQARGAIQDLAYRSMRLRGLADALVAKLTAERTLEPPLLRELLVVAIVLLESRAKPRRESGAPPYPAFTVVDQAVEAAKATPELARVGGLVNGVLRSFVRDANVHRALVTEQDWVARYNHPRWWVERLQRAYPDQWSEVLRVDELAPPLTLRVNLLRTHPDAMLARLAEAGMSAQRIGSCALRLEHPVSVERIPGFAEGLVSVQDEAAQRAASLLDVDHGMRVLDACAAPGGKSAHLLETADVELLALDNDAARLERVRQNLTRLGLDQSGRVRLVAGDAADPAAWWDGQPFDRILADVPCTASGILRRHPDIRWLRRESDIENMAAMQSAILDALWPLLAPGGKLLYVSCSIFPEESVRQAAAFARRHADALALLAPGQLLPVAEAEVDHDGLYFALFEKSGA